MPIEGSGTAGGMRERILEQMLGGAIALVEQRLGGHWDRRRRVRVEICTLDAAAAEWHEEEDLVRIDEDAAEYLDELWLTLVHEAIHMVLPKVAEEVVSRKAEGLTGITEWVDFESPGCHPCQKGWHDMCEGTD